MRNGVRRNNRIDIAAIAKKSTAQAAVTRLVYRHFSRRIADHAACSGQLRAQRDVIAQ